MKRLLPTVDLEVLSSPDSGVLCGLGCCPEELESESETGEDSNCRTPVTRLVTLSQWPFHKDFEGPCLFCESVPQGESDCPGEQFDMLREHPQHVHLGETR